MERTILSDEEIIDLYYARDEQAIVHTRDKYGALLRSVASGITNRIQDVEECENDTYLVAWRCIPPDNPGKYLKGYLTKIIRNKAIDILRKDNSTKRSGILVELEEEIMDLKIDESTPEKEILLKELGAEISCFLKSLKVKHRRIFVSRYWEVESIEQIAKEWGISKSQVGVILDRTRKKLRSYLMKKGLIE